MKKLLLYPLFLGVAYNSVQADTLGAVLNDVINDVVVVEKTGACSANPYLLDASGQHSVTACQPVVAKCPTGTTRMPEISKCSTASSASDTTILSYIKDSVTGTSYYSNGLKTLNDIHLNAKKTGYDTLECASNGYALGFYSFNSDTNTPHSDNVAQGYTPYCFLNLSKVSLQGQSHPQYPATGQNQYASPAWSDGKVVYLADSTFIDKVDNIASHYQCYPVQIKSTVRCAKLPSGLLKKLGY